MTQAVSPSSNPRVAKRTEELFVAQMDASYASTSRMFAGLMVVQWILAIVIAAVWSPFAWAGKVHAIHLHVYLAVFLGGAISSLPIALALWRPAAPITRYVIAIGQMLWSALLIHLTGGRIEAHFHVFASLPFLAFYRDWKVLVPATIVVAGDHLVRGILWPESVYGVISPEWWRFLEHAAWLVFEDVILVLACLRGVEEAHSLAARHAEIETLSESEREKSIGLENAIAELRSSQEALTRTEKLAAVGQLAASVGHELRNPLAAVRNAHTYMGKRLAKDGGPLATDAKMVQFGGIIERELNACSKIIGDLLDFARDRPPNLQPCPLGPLVEESISLVVPKPNVTIKNEVDGDMPVPNLDKDQFRQILINLVQNAVEAMPADRTGEVRVNAEGGDSRPWRITVSDNGAGIPKDIAAKIFQPLFTTKTKGTGLGLAVVTSVIERHRGTIAVDSEPGRGSNFVIEIPGEQAEAGT